MDLLQPMGVSANCMTVSLMMSSGKEEISAERMNHCLPATSTHANFVLASAQTQGQDDGTFTAKDLRYTILLV